MSVNLENIRMTESIQLGSPTAAQQLAALVANCDILVKKISLVNGAAIGASATNYAQVQLLSGGTPIASVDSRAGLAAFGQVTAQQTSVVAGGSGVVSAAGSVLSTSYTPVGTQASAALVNAMLQIEYVRNQNK